MQKIVSVCNQTILYSFYALFFLVPLTFTSYTYELFEFNKMWLTFILGIVIAVSWGVKMILVGRIQIQKTPLDLPILLFLLSQIVSTILSLDPHVSMWGYYSRFNGGLLSILSYVLLYYAFVSNFKDLNQITIKSQQMFAIVFSIIVSIPLALFILYIAVLGNLSGSTITSFLSSLAFPLYLSLALYFFAAAIYFVNTDLIKKVVYIGVASAGIVALWGFTGHFGYDPTCYLFRGTFDVSCWTEAFQPKIRIFSTFGQPNWLGAYLAILLPIAIGLLIQNSKFNPFDKLRAGIQNFKELPVIPVVLLILVILFYVDLLFTGSQSGFGAFWVGLAVLAFPFFKNKPSLGEILETPSTKTLVKLIVVFAVIAFFVGHPIRQLEKFTFPSIQKEIGSHVQDDKEKEPQVFAGELGGTASGAIRKIVWQGALTVWQHNLLFGSGVETFAYAYYKHRPVEHNLTSEWDFLYNKAHNEYLNFLATTGMFGLGSYLFMIGTFLYVSWKKLRPHIHNLSGEQLLPLGLIAAYTTILASNFLGFSVVVINIYFYLIPAFVLFLLGLIDLKQQHTYTLAPNLGPLKNATRNISAVLLFVIGSYLLFLLGRFWLADTHYAKGYNFDRAGEYQLAYPELLSAMNLRPGEPTFQDEYSYNTAVLAVALASQDQATAGAELALESERVSDYIVAKHKNNVVFWKTRVRSFYAMSQMDEKYLPKALEAIKQAAILAPTDAKVSYNLGILYGQNDQVDKAIETLEHTVVLKPDYEDAWYALGLYYREKATDAKGKVIDEATSAKAIETMEYVVNTFPGESSTSARQALDAWTR